ncbi:sensor histidine kinase [Chitinophagaceae bacterium LWZ2-11]
MINSLRKAVYKHGYLIITAAWLYTISFIVTNYWAYYSSPNKVKRKLENRIASAEKKIGDILGNTAVLDSLIIDKGNTVKADLVKENFGLFVYTYNDIDNPILSYWNTNQISIPPEDINKKDSNYYVTYQNGDFEVIRKTLSVNNEKIVGIGVIPIRWDYFIQNKYLTKEFAGYKGLDEQYEITNDKNALPVLNSSGAELFKIKLKEGHSYAGYDILTILLRLAVVILIMTFLHLVALDAAKEMPFTKVFLLFAGAVIFIRLLTYFIPFPFQFNRLELFDPSVYASNWLHPSLGDLLVNVILTFWLVIFYKLNAVQKELRPIKSWVKYVNLIVLVLVSLAIAAIIRSLVQDSKVSFDVTNFFSLDFDSVVCFVILCFLFMTFYNLSHILLRPIIELNVPMSFQALLIAVTGLLFLTFRIGTPSVGGNILIVIWLILYVWLLNVRKKDIYIPILNSSFFIFWVMIFAASITALVMYQNKVVELEQRKKIAERLVTQNDPTGENLLSIAIGGFNDETLAKNFYRFETSEYTNKFVKDSLISENFSGYLNKYETRIYTYDKFFKPLYNDDSTVYSALYNIINNQGKKTNIEGVYTYQNADDKLSYVYEKTIQNKGEILGYLFVVAKPKRYKSEALYPELFNQSYDISLDMGTNYSYAVYYNNKLINRYNDYGFPLQLPVKFVQDFTGLRKEKNGYDELWYNAGNGKVVAIAKENNFFLETATMFAYLFVIFLIVIFLYRTANYIGRTRLDVHAVKQLFRFNIRTQIHATIIFITVFSFVVIGIATISFFIIRFDKSNQERLSKNIEVMANEIQEKVKQVHAAQSFDDVLTLNDVGFSNDLERKITEVSEIHNVDVNFYRANGTLRASTQPYIYNKLLLSDKMDPTAYFELHYNNSSKFIQSEKIGNLRFLSIYIPVFDEDGHVSDYLNIPYLNSQVELNQEIAGFLVTLINLNAFIFLLAGAIAFFVTNRIVASFTLIGNKMKDVALGKVNEAIVWNRDDEINVLVNEYNKMVNKLEQSAVALARSEREGAWREMARQVAHEIKNPLTPMKLSMQYLQKAIDSDAPNTKELTERVAATLIEQIDQLAQIAGDFSQFANINNVNPEKFDISETISSMINLYQANGEVSIVWEKNDNKNYTVVADKLQMNRLFTNLIKNGIEAAKEGEEAHITIKQKLQGNKIIITVTDTGLGIPDNMIEKIFRPNFTTKTSGTGLGLAMCKGIVEKAGGQISFTTKEGEGTTFIIELPLAE